MAPDLRASRTISGRSHPTTAMSRVYLRSARAKEPPIRPVPRMVTRLMRWAMESAEVAIDSGSNDTELIHQLRKFARCERLRAIGKGVIGIGVHFHEQAIGTGGKRRPS